MKLNLTPKDWILGIIWPTALVFLSYLITNSSMQFWITIKPILPFLAILWAIAYFAFVIMKRIGKLKDSMVIYSEFKVKITTLKEYTDMHDRIIFNQLRQSMDVSAINTTAIIEILKDVSDTPIHIQKESKITGDLIDITNAEITIREDNLVSKLEKWKE